MYTLIISLILIAFLLLYNLSKKNRWEGRPVWLQKIQSNKSLSRSLSFAVLGLSLAMLIFICGPGSGIFMFIVILMAAGSSVVLLTPFQYFKAKHLAILFVISIIFEFIIF